MSVVSENKNGNVDIIVKDADEIRKQILNKFAHWTSGNTCLCNHFGCSWPSFDSLYLKYSQQKGGQASALLDDVVAEKRKAK